MVVGKIAHLGGGPWTAARVGISGGGSGQLAGGVAGAGMVLVEGGSGCFFAATACNSGEASTALLCTKQRGKGLG